MRRALVWRTAGLRTVARWADMRRTLSRWPVVGRAMRRRPVARRPMRPVHIVVMPAIAVAIKRPIAVVTIPIAVEAEGDDRNAKWRVIFRTDIDPLVLIDRLQIVAGDPAANSRVGRITPGRI